MGKATKAGDVCQEGVLGKQAFDVEWEQKRASSSETGVDVATGISACRAQLMKGVAVETMQRNFKGLSRLQKFRLRGSIYSRRRAGARR